MKRARQLLRLHRVTVRELSHVIGGAPAFGGNDQAGKREETDKCNNGNANGHDKVK